MDCNWWGGAGWIFIPVAPREEREGYQVSPLLPDVLLKAIILYGTTRISDRLVLYSCKYWQFPALVVVVMSLYILLLSEFENQILVLVTLVALDYFEFTLAVTLSINTGTRITHYTILSARKYVPGGWLDRIMQNKWNHDTTGFRPPHCSLSMGPWGSYKVPNCCWNCTWAQKCKT